MIESHLESNAKHEQIKCEKITMSINHVFLGHEKNFGPGCPRMNIWTELVRTAVRAEVPDYEVMQTMAMFLGGLENNDVGDDVIRRLAIWFRFDPVTWFKLMGNTCVYTLIQ